MSLLPDDKDRAAASRTFDVNVIVEAGAGTGKTTILINRLCFWLLGCKDSSLEKVVALTFTEKAAAEIKIRLAAALVKIVSDIRAGRRSPLLSELAAMPEFSAEKTVAKAEESLALVDRAQMGTIHSFALHILRLYPFEAGISASVEADSGPVFEMVFEREWNSWTETELGENSPRGEQWAVLLAKADLPTVREFAAALCKKGARYRGPSMRKKSDIAAACAELAAEAKTLAAKYSVSASKPRDVEKELLKAGNALHSLAEILCGTACALGAREKIKTALTRPKDWAEDDFERAKHIARFAAGCGPESHQLLELARELLWPFIVRFNTAYGKAGVISFDDIISRARNLIAENRVVRDELKSKYSAVMIDEFQDIDPQQGELLLFLAENKKSFASDWRNIRMEPGKLFIVGDPKQSIYRFRGADINAYEEFTGLLLGQGARFCRLSSNFRSVPALVNAVNEVAEKVLVKESAYQPGYAPIAAARNCAVQGPKAEIFAFSGDDADSVRARQAEYIAAAIKHSLGKPFHSDGRPLKLKDIAILMRSMTSLSVFLDALRKHGIRYVVDEEKYFYSTQEITDVLNLLRIIDNPQDKVAMAGFLRSPLGAVDDRSLYELALAGKLDYTIPAPEGFECLDHVYRQLRKLRELKGKVPAAELARAALCEMRAFEILPYYCHGEQSLANINKLLDVLEGYSAKAMSLGEFLRFSEKYVSGSIGEGESQLADDFTEAVSVTSIHKSKGLEFPVVFLPNISAVPSRSGKKPFSIYNWKKDYDGFRMGKFADPALGLLEIEQEKHARAEEVRLFYVAMTRAKEKLVMLCGADGAPRGSMAEYLLRAGVCRFEDGAITGISDNFFAATGPEITVVAEKFKEPVSENKIDCAAWKTALAARQERYKIGQPEFFSSYSAQGDAGHGGEDFSAARERGAALGILCHRVMQNHSFKSPVGKEEVLSAAAYLGFQDNSGIWNDLLPEALKILSGFSATAVYKELAQSEIFGMEVPFAFRSAENEGVGVRGVLDLVLRTPKGLVVADYKSEQISGKDISEATEKYAAQSRIYKLAVNKVFGQPAAGFKVVFLRTGDSVVF